jgi:hypothetical protein
MIKHIVMWKLKDEAEGADRATNAARMKEKLDACRGLVPGIVESRSLWPARTSNRPATSCSTRCSPIGPRSTPTRTTRCTRP